MLEIVGSLLRFAVAACLMNGSMTPAGPVTHRPPCLGCTFLCTALQGRRQCWQWDVQPQVTHRDLQAGHTLSTCGCWAADAE